MTGQTAAEILTHLSFIFSFAAYFVRDMVWLRVLVITSSLVWLGAMAANNGWIVASVLWNGVFIAVNTYNITALLRENRAVSFTEDERELYETLFRSFRPGEFLKILRVARWMKAAPNQVLLQEGQPVTGVGLIMEGDAEVTVEEKHRARLSDLDLFGEMGYLSGEPATGTVTARTALRYVWWDKSDLELFFKRHPALRPGCHSVITDDLRKKLSRRGDQNEPPACSGGT